ncbi:MAG: TlpA disulfide reductase family protein [Planctomycetota bacterium]
MMYRTLVALWTAACVGTSAHAQFGGPVEPAEKRKTTVSKRDREAEPLFTDPALRVDSVEYGKAAWPTRNTRRAIRGRDVQGFPLPVVFGESERWLTEEPDELKGKVLVLDFWATWCGPCVRAKPGLVRLQREFADDLVVVAVSGQSEPESKVISHLRSSPPQISHAFDAGQRVYRGLAVNAIPHVVVLSTDRVVRWQGNPLDPKFAQAVRRVVAADPLVERRREVRANLDANDALDEG